MTDDERARLRRAWQPIGDALQELETANQAKNKKFWKLVNALLAFRMTMQETQVLESEEVSSNGDNGEEMVR